VDQQAYRKAIAEALEEAKQGAFISAEKIFAWLEHLDADPNAPKPEPDVFKG